MKRKKECVIGSLLTEYLRCQGLETPLNEYRLLASWGEVMGNVVEKMTGNLRIVDEVLYVEVKSASLRADLSLQRSEIVKKLNVYVGATVIKDIRLR